MSESVTPITDLARRRQTSVLEQILLTSPSNIGAKTTAMEWMNDAQQTHERAAGAGQRHPAEVAATQRFLMRDLLRRVGSAGETERGGEDKKAASPSRTKFFSFPSPPTSPISLSISSLVPHCRGTARTFRESMRFTDPTRPCSQQQLDVTSECLPSAPASPSRFKRLQNSFSTCRRKRDPGSTSPKMSRQPTF